MTSEELEKLLKVGYESNGVEFKGPGKRTDKDFLARVIRAVLGMSNRRDGGLIVIGVGSNNLEPIGLSPEELNTWSNYDDVSASINEYASPSARFDIEIVEISRKFFIVLYVYEFADIPILCTKDYNVAKSTVLRRGGCYVRARHKPETSEIPSEEEMRELLNLAIDKGVKDFVDRARHAGMIPTWFQETKSSHIADPFQLLKEDLE